MSPVEAERAKHSDGFVASSLEPATSDAWARIHEVTVSELAPFARDLRQTLAACRARTGYHVAAALLVGGGARLRGLASYLTEQLGVPAWRPTADDVTALAGPRLGADPVASAAVDAAAMTIGMAYDAASGRPQFDLRQGALALRVDLSFLRSKAVPLIASAFVIAGFAVGAAYADLYRLRKAEKILGPRLAQETAEHFGESRSAKAVLTSIESSPGGATASPLPKMSAYDILLEISLKVPAKDKIVLDVDRLDITDSKVEMSGTAKTPEEVDALVAELKKIECFKDVTRGPSETGENGVKKFKLTISAQCM
jgi:general secretion pathway protein L